MAAVQSAAQLADCAIQHVVKIPTAILGHALLASALVAQTA
jgi:hypothetical protein